MTLPAQTASLRRCEIFLFLACFFAFAYFDQGGGWNQNARFAEVRAIVEEGRFAIDDFLVYQKDLASDDLIRCPLTRAEYDWQGDRYRLCWVDMEWNLFPVGDAPLGEGVKKAAMVERCNSGDIGYVPWSGQFHPNKPPGTTFFGVPGYFLIYHVERLLGINPNHWWVLDVNAWLTGVLSVSLGSALACVLFFRLAREFSEGNMVAALVATLATALGTTFFPFATIFFDHSLTASLLIAAFFLLRTRPLVRGSEFVAGLCGGMAVLTNYVAIGAVAILGVYLLVRGARNWRRVAMYAAGGVGPFLLLCWYGWQCYGNPFKASTDFQNPLFHDDGALLGMFNLPHTLADWGHLSYVAQLLAISPYRGVFWLSPILILGFIGALVWLRERTLFAEAGVCLGVFLWFFGVNAAFNGYHAGFAAGPRYLVPALPFLGLPVVVAFARWRPIAGLVAVLSIGINLLLTATDAQNPVGVGGHARVEGRRTEWSYRLLGDYAWPLFVHGRAWPLLREQVELQLDKDAANDGDAVSRESQRKAYMESIEEGDPSPFLLASIEGPVSVNPIGAYEGLLNYGFYPPGSPQVHWASFNVGEFLFPQSRWSLLPLLLVSGSLGAFAWRAAKRTSGGSQ